MPRFLLGFLALTLHLVSASGTASAQNGSIQGRVFEDQDGNGFFNGPDAGLLGVTVYIDANGNQTPDAGEAAFSTDALGTFMFTGLAQGTHTLRAVVPSSAFTQTFPAANGPQSVTISSPDHFVDFIDFGFTQGSGGAATGAIGNYTWVDTDGNGRQDDTEPALLGVQVALFTAAGAQVATTTSDGLGFYGFASVEAGSYYLTFTPPTGWIATTADSAADEVDSDPDPATGKTSTITLTAGQFDGNWDAGFYQQVPVSGLAWADLDGNQLLDDGEGLSGVDVLLFQDVTAKTGAAPVLIAQTATSAIGSFSFAAAPGVGYYVATFPGPSYGGGSLATVTWNGSTGYRSASFVLSSGTSFSLLSSSVMMVSLGGSGEIGDRVWEDLDGDGIQDASEPGIASVTVRLLGPGGDGTLGTADDTVEGTDVTDSLGLYSFGSLFNGTYLVRVDQSTLPATNFLASYDADSTPDGETQATVTGSTISNVDFGFVREVNLSGRIWHDADGSDIRESGESGISGITVKLFTGSTTTPAQTTVTNSSGAYTFNPTLPASYRIGVDLGPYGVRSIQDFGTDDGVDSDVSSSTGQVAFSALAGDNLTFDAGLYDYASVGDFMWEDLNGNGIQDGGEPGIAASVVELLDPAGTVLSATSTLSTGAFSFTSLEPGDYKLRYLPSTGTLTPTLVRAGSNAALDSDADPSTAESPLFSLGSGSTLNDLDAGFVSQASLGDFVWEDTNGNGIQDSGEAGIGSVAVTLLDHAGALAGSTTTNSLGAWAITGLVPGTYELEVVPPAGFSFTLQNKGSNDLIDSDVDSVGRTGPFSLSSGVTANRWDAGLFPTALVSFNSTSSTTVDEATGPFGVSVKLTVPGGGTISSGVTVTISDDGTGTATSGADYNPFTASTVSFASGSADGATSTFWVTILDDGTSEGSETVDASMIAITGPGLVGAVKSHTVEITDDDGPQIAATPLAGHTLPEPGGNSTFTMVLNAFPTADVTIALSSSDASEGSVSPSSITFTRANGMTPQTVTISSADDDLDDGDVTWQVVTAPAVSSDAAFGGLDAADVVVITQDNDTAGITVLSVSSLSTSETGTTTGFTVALDSEPTANVEIGLSSSDATEGSVSPSSLTFTAANWSNLQSVTATGVDDSLLDGDVSYDVVTAPGVSSDASYSGLDARDVSILNTDDDVVVCDALGPFYTYEDQVLTTITLSASGVYAGSSFSTTASLDGDGSEVNLSAVASQAVDAATGVIWEFIYYGEHDLIIDGDQTIGLNFLVSSDDPSWDGLSCDWDLINVDNGLEVAYLRMPDPVTAHEDETAVSSSVELIPDLSSSTVNWSIASDGDGTEFDFSVVGDATGGTIEYTGLQDCTTDGDQSENFTVSLSSSDAAFDGVSGTVVATNEDSASACRGTFGDFVWYDSDGDGRQDASESGASGVSLVLYRGDGTLYSTTTTASDGSYSFSVPAGRYILSVVPPSNFGPTLKDVGVRSDSRDSDADQLTNRTDAFLVAAEANISSIDIGLIERLCGTYSIGSFSSADYADIPAAADDLVLRGVSCKVVFQVNPEPFTQTEPVDLTSIGGVSSTNTVTFASGSSSANPYIGYFPSGDDPAIILGSDYLTLDGIDVHSHHTTVSKVIFLNASHLAIKNSTFEADGKDTPVSGVIDVYYSGSPVTKSHLTISGNTIAGGAQGISLHASANDLVISNNRITGQAFSSINSCGTGSEITGNTLERTVHLSGCDGAVFSGNTLSASLEIAETNPDLVVDGNTIAGGTEAILVYRVGASSSVIVSNNFISGASVGINVLHSSHNMGFYHNTIIANDTGVLIESTSNSNLELVNNIISGVSTALSVEDGGSMARSDYNVMKTGVEAAGFLATSWNGVRHSSLASLQAASGMDANSLVKSVEIVGGGDLHLAGSSIGDSDLAGTGSVSVGEDADADIRNLACPYIGADEASSPLCLQLRTINMQMVFDIPDIGSFRSYADTDGNGSIDDDEEVFSGGPRTASPFLATALTDDGGLLVRIENAANGKSEVAVLFQGVVQFENAGASSWILYVGGLATPGDTGRPITPHAIPTSDRFALINGALSSGPLEMSLTATGSLANEDTLYVGGAIRSASGVSWGSGIPVASPTRGLPSWTGDQFVVRGSNRGSVTVVVTDEGGESLGSQGSRLTGYSVDSEGTITRLEAPGSLDVFHAASPAGLVDVFINGMQWVSAQTSKAGQLDYLSSTGRIALPGALAELSIGRRGKTAELPIAIKSSTPDRVVLGSEGDWLRAIPVSRAPSDGTGQQIAVLDATDPGTDFALRLLTPWTSAPDQDSGEWASVSQETANQTGRVELWDETDLVHLFQLTPSDYEDDILIVFDSGDGFTRRNGITNKSGNAGYALTVLTSGASSLRGTALGSLLVRLVDDLDQDGIADPGEPGLAGLSVRATVLSTENSEVASPGVVFSGLSNASGVYQVSGLPAGDYRLEVDGAGLAFSGTLGAVSEVDHRAAFDLGRGYGTTVAARTLYERGQTVAVTSADPTGAGSLSDAIDIINGGGQSGTIDLSNLSGKSGTTIQLTAPLSPITVPLRLVGGGQTTIDGALLAAGTDGLTIESSRVVVEGLTFSNFSGHGIVVNAPEFVVIQDNRITGVGGDGIRVLQGSGHALRRNVLTSIAGLGIDLGGDGPTANDPDDADTGANGLRNSPTLDSAHPGSTVIAGSVSGTPDTDIVLDFYSVGSCASNLWLESWLGESVVELDLGGTASFQVTLDETAMVGGGIAATVTSADGSTSEISGCVSVSILPAVVSIAITPEAITLVVGNGVKFEASGTDQFGSPVLVAPQWTTTGGDLESDGYYTADTVGSFTVTATLPISGLQTTASVEVVSGVDAETEAVLPTEFDLGQNYPNPFNPVTRVLFSVPEATEVRIELFSVLGQRVASIASGHFAAGHHEVSFDASGLSTGVYLYRMSAGSFAQVKRMTLVR